MSKRVKRFVSLEEARESWKIMDEEKKDKKKWRKKVYRKKIYVFIDEYCESVKYCVPIRRKRTTLKELDIVPVDLKEIISKTTNFFLCTPKCSLYKKFVYGSATDGEIYLEFTSKIHGSLGEPARELVSSELGIPKEDIAVHYESPYVAEIHIKSLISEEPPKYEFEVKTFNESLKENSAFQEEIETILDVFKRYVEENKYLFLEMVEIGNSFEFLPKYLNYL